MAFQRSQACCLLLALLVSLQLTAGLAYGFVGDVAVYWGRNKDEGTLREACDAGTYDTVIISFLVAFGHGKYTLDLSGHDIAGIGDDIYYCRVNKDMIRSQACCLLLALLVSIQLTSGLAAYRRADVAVYWGRNKDEGTLREACDTGEYTTVIISFLVAFGHGKYTLDLSGHDIAGVGDDINYCKSKGIMLTAGLAAYQVAGGVTVYWGRNRDEGTLREACDTGLYTTVIISFLSVFGHGKYALDLSGHDIAGVGDDINYCKML
ncbi:hypothetical protein EJB05_26927, partial [Eragrostis curvula]